MYTPKLYSIHDQTLTIELSMQISEEVHALIMEIHTSLLENKFDGFIESVPAYTSLTIYFNENISVHHIEIVLLERYQKCIEALSKKEYQPKQSIDHIIPVCYDESMGLDLEDIAIQCKLSIKEIIQIHTSHVFRVYMLGFIPGFPYMGILPPSLETKRKNNPRPAVPAGSVAVAGLQTGIYPSSIPGGWNIIGRTPVKMFDKLKNPCSFLSPGNLVQFKSITRTEFETYE